jgi:hypothetical protein
MMATQPFSQEISQDHSATPGLSSSQTHEFDSSFFDDESQSQAGLQFHDFNTQGSEAEFDFHDFTGFSQDHSQPTGDWPQTQSDRVDTAKVGNGAGDYGLNSSAGPTVDDPGTVELDFKETFDEDSAPAYESSFQLPVHACKYCGIHNPASVVRCLKSGKWFCNSSSNKFAGSCIINHLVRYYLPNEAIRECQPGCSEFPCFEQVQMQGGSAPP